VTEAPVEAEAAVDDAPLIPAAVADESPAGDHLLEYAADPAAALSAALEAEAAADTLPTPAGLPDTRGADPAPPTPGTSAALEADGGPLLQATAEGGQVPTGGAQRDAAARGRD
jgi:hypothetical protein